MAPRPALFWLLALFASSALAADDVEVTLSRLGGDAPAVAGRSIRLDLAFRALADGVTLFEHPPGDEPGLDLSVSPSTGVTLWRAEMDRWMPGQHDVVMRKPIPRGDPVHDVLELSDSVRFDRPGIYTVVVTTRRTGRPISTNPLRIEVVLPDVAADDAERVRLTAEVRQAGHRRASIRAAQALNWLPGDEAARVRIDMLLHPEVANPHGADVMPGLWAARDRRRIVSALEAAIVDPAQDLNVRDAVLQKLVVLKLSLDAPPGASRDEVAALGASILRDELHRLAETLTRRTGASRMDAARLILSARPNAPSLDVDVAAARDTMIEHFDDASEWWLDSVLRNPIFAIPAMVPVLTRYLGTHVDPRFDSTHGVALELLIRLDPAEARRFVVQVVCMAQPVNFDRVRDLPVATLPEADDCLRAGLSNEAGLPNLRVFMRGVRLAYVARFASPALLDAVEPMFERLGTEGLERDARGAALTYLLRWRPERYQPVLEQTLDSTDASLAVFSIERAAFPPEGALLDSLRRRLASPDTAQAALAAYGLSRVGEADDRERLRARLAEVRRQAVASPGDVRLGELEISLAAAVVEGHRWAFSADEAHATFHGCVSDRCRANYRVP